MGVEATDHGGTGGGDPARGWWIFGFIEKSTGIFQTEKKNKIRGLVLDIYRLSDHQVSEMPPICQQRRCFLVVSLCIPNSCVRMC